MAVIIKDIKKNSNEIIRIEVSEFKGRELINIRIWYQSMDSDQGEMVYKPTPKGVILNVSEFEELRDGVEKLGNYLHDKSRGTGPDQPGSEPKNKSVDEKEAD